MSEIIESKDVPPGEARKILFGPDIMIGLAVKGVVALAIGVLALKALGVVR